MEDASVPQPNQTRVRLGLALISVVVLVAVAMIFLVRAPAGKAVMFAIAAAAFVRAYLLFRSMRADTAGS
jgi:hypothetical protein